MRPDIDSHFPQTNRFIYEEPDLDDNDGDDGDDSDTETNLAGFQLNPPSVLERMLGRGLVKTSLHIEEEHPEIIGKKIRNVLKKLLELL